MSYWQLQSNAVVDRWMMLVFCRAYQRLTAAGRESEDAIAMLCEKTEVLNSPPPTPRVAEAPNQSHRRIIPASALPALKSHWLKFSSPGKSGIDMFDNNSAYS